MATASSQLGRRHEHSTCSGTLPTGLCHYWEYSGFQEVAGSGAVSWLAGFGGGCVAFNFLAVSEHSSSL